MDRTTEEWQQISGAPATLPWEEIAVFRETFLSLLHPECAAAFRRVGETVYNWAIEDQFSFGRSARSWVARDLGGAALDLRFLEAFLGDVGRATQLSHLTPEEEAQAALAGRVAHQMGRGAGNLERATPCLEGQPGAVVLDED